MNTNKSRRGGIYKEKKQKNGRPKVEYFNKCTKFKLIKYSDQKA